MNCGHPYEPGQRKCRPCRRERHRLGYAAKTAAVPLCPKLTRAGLPCTYPRGHMGRRHVHYGRLRTERANKERAGAH